MKESRTCEVSSAAAAEATMATVRRRAAAHAPGCLPKSTGVARDARSSTTIKAPSGLEHLWAFPQPTRLSGAKRATRKRTEGRKDTNDQCPPLLCIRSPTWRPVPVSLSFCSCDSFLLKDGVCVQGVRCCLGRRLLSFGHFLRSHEVLGLVCQSMGEDRFMHVWAMYSGFP